MSGNKLDPKKVQITLELDEVTAGLLAILDLRNRSAHSALLTLIDHAAQGVYRPGAWERQWIEQAFGCDWQSRLEPGDPWDRSGGNGVRIFQRPIVARLS